MIQRFILWIHQFFSLIHTDFLIGSVPAQKWIFMQRKLNICILLTPYFPTYLFFGGLLAMQKRCVFWLTSFTRSEVSDISIGQVMALLRQAVRSVAQATQHVSWYVCIYIYIYVFMYICTYYVHIMNIQIIVVIFQPPLLLTGGKLANYLNFWPMKTSDLPRSTEFRIFTVEKTDWKSPEIFGK